MGKTSCGTIEIWVSTWAQGIAASSLPVSVSVRFQETGTWSDFLLMPPAEGQPADSTARLRQNLDFVGTPTAVRYSLPPRENRHLWWPRDLAVRANEGLWYKTNSTNLCPVDANCREAAGCVGGQPGYGVLMDGGNVVVNCATVYRTSAPEPVSPLAPGV